MYLLIPAAPAIVILSSNLGGLGDWLASDPGGRALPYPFILAAPPVIDSILASNPGGLGGWLASDPGRLTV